MAVKIVKVKDFPVDGRGSAKVWADVKWHSLSKINDGESAYETRFKSVYSDSGIYFLLDCEDSKITSTIRKDFADLFTEDVVEIFLWPNQSEAVYFEYEISPHGFELPIIVPNNRGVFYGWLPWHYTGERKTRKATHIKTVGEKVMGWSAEFFIPYKLLTGLGNVPPKKGTVWKVNVYRKDFDQRRPTHWAWQPKVGTNFHDYKRFGKFVFGRSLNKK